MNRFGIAGRNASMMLFALALTSCGGGGGSGDASRDDCHSTIPGLCDSLYPGDPVSDPSPSEPPSALTLSILPNEITTSDCTTNIPFIFSGGTAPYTILTSDNQLVPVSSALPLGSKHYFMASVRSMIDDFNPLGTFFEVPHRTTVTVLDSQSQAATASINIASGHICPVNPVLQTDPASANAHVTEILAFQITGGQGPYSVVSSDPSIVSVPSGNLPGTTFNATATASNRTTQETALLTVTASDGQKTNIRFTVLP